MKRIPLAILVLLAAAGWAAAQGAGRSPQIGYLYPAGGQQGTTFEVTAGGQRLTGVDGVLVSGDGVTATVVKWYRPIRKLQKEERDLLMEKVRTRRDQLLAQSGGSPAGLAPLSPLLQAGKGQRRIEKSLAAPARKPEAGPPANNSTNPTPLSAARPGPKGEGKPAQPQPLAVRPAGEKPASPAAANPAQPGALAAAKPEVVKLPSHPLLDRIDQLDLRELQLLADEFLSFKQKQMNLQIAELVVIRVTVAAGATPGDRELRLLTPAGLSNPLTFQVGVAPEFCEMEPNDPGSFWIGPPLPPAQVPVVLNGQIKPGDLDRFRFQARRGQHLVITGQARRLVPYLADAVPGWFQATLSLYDEQGKELAFADDYTFDPDPVLFFEVPQDGIYQIEIRDSIFRGREDFVYRLTVAEQPFVRKVFPLGGPLGQAVVAAIDGWNLPAKTLNLDTSPDGPARRQARLKEGPWVSDPVTYGVGKLPEITEATPDTTTTKAQTVKLPCVVNGRIGKPGDVDAFEFEGRAGQEVVAEVQARCYRSPLDSLLRLVDAKGKVLAMNDDCENKESGLETHHADSYLRFRLPAAGAYRVRLSDAQNHGGDDFAYRLRLSEPQPDFVLRVTPSSVSVPAGQFVPLTVYALRKDGFDGPIEVNLAGAPGGFVLTGGQIQPGQERLQVTLAAPLNAPAAPVALRLEGKARLGDQEVVRPVEPAEDRMQAFLYRHLTPSQQLLVSVLPGRRFGPGLTAADKSPVVLKPGGSAEIRLQVPRWLVGREVKLSLADPPDGVSLGAPRSEGANLVVPVSADAKAARPGTLGNLLIEVLGDPPTAAAKGKSVQAKRQLSLGFVPAIPFRIEGEKTAAVEKAP